MVPIENLATVPTPIKEDEVVAGHYILSHRMRHDGVQAIELLAHIGTGRLHGRTGC